MNPRTTWLVVVGTTVGMTGAAFHRAGGLFLAIAALAAALMARRTNVGSLSAAVIAGVAWSAAIGPWSRWDRWLAAAAAAVALLAALGRLQRQGVWARALAAAVVVAGSSLAVQPIPAHGDVPAGDRFQAIDDLVRREMSGGQIPGVAVAVVDGDRVVYARGYGTAGGRPITVDTPVVIGSTSKSMTALATVQLVEQGRIDLDAPISRYLRWLDPVDGRLSQVTVRQLLIDTSGIPTWAGWSGLAGDGKRDTASLRRLVNNLRLAGTPGETFRYSNANYIVLGEIIEAVTNAAFNDVLNDAIFQPLEMTHTAAAAPPDLAANRYWLGLPIRSQLPYLEIGIPAGAITASASDLATYLRAQLDDTSTTVISDTARLSLHTPAVDAEGFGVPPGREYAMGWYVGTVAGEPAVFHSGDVFDSSSSLVLLPEHGIGVAVVATASSAVVPVSKTLAEGVTAEILGKPAPPAFARSFPANSLAAIALASGLLAFAITRAMRLMSRPPTLRAVPRLVAVDIGVPLAIIVGLPLAFSTYLDRAETLSPVAFWRLAIRGVPDVATLLVAALLIRALAAAYALALTARPRRTRSAAHDRPDDASRDPALIAREERPAKV